MVEPDVVDPEEPLEADELPFAVLLEELPEPVEPLDSAVLLVSFVDSDFDSDFDSEDLAAVEEEELLRLSVL